jgi:hypothetical protein
MSLKNLIVKGKFYQYSIEKLDIEGQKKLYNDIKTRIRHYFLTDYNETSPIPIHYDFANMEFIRKVPRPQEPDEKKSLFPLFPTGKTKKENPYFKHLGETTDSAIWRLNICCYPLTIREKDAIVIDVTSEPAIIHKYQQLGQRRLLNQDDIDLIVYENVEFVLRFANANLFNVLEIPKPIGSTFNTDVTIKLRAFNFNKIADLLEKGRQEVENGQSENGLVTLRSAIEFFFVEVLTRKGITPAPQKDVNKNIDKLHSLGFIDSTTHRNLLKLSYNGLYTNLSEVTHDRISRDYFDSRFYFDITEEIFNYVLERVIKFNLRFEPNNKVEK